MFNIKKNIDIEAKSFFWVYIKKVLCRRSNLFEKFCEDNVEQKFRLLFGSRAYIYIYYKNQTIDEIS